MEQPSAVLTSTIDKRDPILLKIPHRLSAIRCAESFKHCLTDIFGDKSQGPIRHQEIGTSSGFRASEATSGAMKVDR